MTHRPGIPIPLAALTTLVVVAAAVSLSADTLVMRDGRRVGGDLISIRNGVIEFEERGGFSNRVLRVSREEVRRIELDDRDDEDARRDDVRPTGRGQREREVIVSADVAWVDTGIDVRAGQQLAFTARGNVWWGPGRKDGPRGEQNSPHNPNRPMPGRPAAALIGKVGDDAGAFFIGDEEEPLRMRSSGRLYLGVNDDVVRDNHGNFRVVVSY
jgi:hypothetical protein